MHTLRLQVPWRYLNDIRECSLKYVIIEKSIYDHLRHDPPVYVQIIHVFGRRNEYTQSVLREFAGVHEGIESWWIEFKPIDCEKCIYYNGETLSGDACGHPDGKNCNGSNYYQPRDIRDAG